VASGEAARVTGLPNSPNAIAWSPDGQRIAYVMTVPDEGLQLGKAPPKPEGAAWAPPLEIIDKVTYRADGSGYLKPGFDHLFLVDADGGAPRQLTFGAWNDAGPLAWSPDGGSILFSTVRRGDWQREVLDSDIYALDLTTGRLSQLTTRKGPDFGAAISPDGGRIAFLGWDDVGKGYEQARVYVMDRDGSGVRPVAAGLDRDVDHLEWARDGRALVASYEEDGGKRVSRITLDGRVTPLATGLVDTGLDRPYSGGSFTLARNGAIAFTTGDVHRPADVAVALGGRSRTLTRLNADFLAGKRLGEVRELSARAPDGWRVPGWLVLPPSYVPGQRVPLILEIHGGPYAAYGPHFSTDYQLYAAAGYAVLYTNPRGSTGYGQDFVNGIQHSYPGKDFDDLMAGVDTLLQKGFVDARNMFVTGCSGGGVLTAWVVGHTDRFAAASSNCPVIDWLSFVGTTDGPGWYYRFAKMPWEDPSEHIRRSPLTYVGNVKTPTMLMTGELDLRTPMAQTEQFYRALKLRKVPTAMIRFNEEWHGTGSRPSNFMRSQLYLRYWFDKYSRSAATTTSSGGAR
jgi:dipeptidyl aminopeptidase/acylaminoacyl peptidase